MKYGELGDKFYIILQGSWDLYLKTKEKFSFTNPEYVCFLLTHEVTEIKPKKVLRDFGLNDQMSNNYILIFLYSWWDIWCKKMILFLFNPDKYI